MFTTLIVKPIFNLLVLIYAILPGHNFGLAIIIFTILVRLLMWPLVKKQLHHAKALRALQPELKKIKAQAAGDRQKESAMVMALYKERQVKPLGSLGIIVIQVIVLLGLYRGLYKIIQHPHDLISFSYTSLQHLPWMQTLAHHIDRFDNSLLGLVDLGRTALDKAGVYWPALLLAATSAVAQFFQSKQLMPTPKDARNLRQILREAGKQGKTADQSEVSAAVGRSTLYFFPFLILLVALRLAAALPLYWLTSSVVAYFQQAKVLKEDVAEAEVIVRQSEKTEAASQPSRRRRVKSKVNRRRRR